jgi:hypothetical protein
MVLLAGCAGSAGSSPSAASTMATPTSTPLSSVIPTAPPASTGPTTPISDASPAASACPPAPPNASPVAPPFVVGGDYQLSLGEGGIDHPPAGLAALTDWRVSSPSGCIADILAFQFMSASEASSFAREQAEGVGLEEDKIGDTTVWFSASGDAARLAIGSLALSITVDSADPTTARDLVQKILGATLATG